MKGVKHGEGVYKGLRKDLIGTWRNGELVSER